MANAIAFLANENASFITGHLLIVDGGKRLVTWEWLNYYIYKNKQNNSLNVCTAKTTDKNLVINEMKI